MSSLKNFWPTSDALRSVIASQAEGLGEMAFLAVHQPMEFRRKDYGGDESVRLLESDLLEFLLRDSGDGSVIVPVLGRSGVGKSHAVRWLYEQLRAREDAERFVLLWVPRTRSAKGVLTDLLALPEFRGSEWDDLRSDVGAATDGLSLARAARILRDEVVLRLQDEAPTEAPSSERDFIRQAGSQLAQFIDDPNVWPIPPNSAIEASGGAATGLSPWIRLAEHLVSGNIDPDDEGARRFLGSDFEFAEDLGDRIGAQAQEFWTYLQVGLPVVAGVSMAEAAIDVLNRLLDGAKASVLGLSRTPISELFVQLRERLHDDGRELVLLIEDMTVMSGLQRSLLDVMVQPSSTPAGARLCPIRTALALTPGYMQGGALPDNVMGRAIYEWWVEEELEEALILSKYEGLTAGYLNAARHAAALGEPSDELFDVNEGDVDADLVDQVRAFGSHEPSGRPLFPFNRAAIEVLARARVHDAGRLLYNPRRYINLVLEPLLQMRGAFEAGAFPTTGNGLPRLRSIELGAKLRNSAGPGDESRLLSIVAIWGGQPSSWSEVERMPSALFHAFGMTPPDGTADGLPVPEVDDASPDKSAVEVGRTPVPQPSVEGIDPGSEPPIDPISAQLEELRDWGAVPGHRLPQTIAHEVRQATAQLLVDILPVGWPGLANTKVSDLKKHIYIHSAMGNNQLTPETAMVSLPAREPAVDQGQWNQYQNELVALLRWHSSDDKGLSYFRAAESLPDLVSLADRIGQDAAAFIRSRPLELRSEMDMETLKEAASVQLLGSKVGGGRTGGPLENRLTDLFGGLDMSAFPKSAPDELRKALSMLAAAVGESGAVRDYLLAPYAAFQGRGHKVQGIDAVGLIKVLEGVTPGIPSRRHLNRIRRGLAEELISALGELREWVNEKFSKSTRDITQWFGDDSPTAVRDEIEALAGEALAEGSVVREARAVQRCAERIDGGDTKRLLGQISSLGAFEPTTLVVLREIDWGTLGALQEFVVCGDVFMDALDAELGHLSVTDGDDLASAVRRTFEQELDRASAALEE